MQILEFMLPPKCPGEKLQKIDIRASKIATWQKVEVKANKMLQLQAQTMFCSRVETLSSMSTC
jgi:hypothetical protein